MIKVPLLPADKLGHFFWGTVIGLTAGAMSTLLWTPVWAGEVGTGVASLVMAIKERLDRVANIKSHESGEGDVHGVEWWDWIAGSLGGFAAAAPYMLLKFVARS